MDYVDVEKARSMHGLRLVLTAGVPGPWGEAAKGLFEVKGIDYVPVAQEGGGANDTLREWTGFDNAPQAIYEDERARLGWVEILFLAERLAPSPSLIPSDSEDRVRMFGLVNELAGEMGFAWCRRIQLFRPMLSLPDADTNPAIEPIRRMARKYYLPEQAEQADARVVEILATLARALRSQQERGSGYLVGDRLSAADIYWATFAAMIEPLPPDQCPMSNAMRAAYTVTDETILAATDPMLLEHRDRIYAEHLRLPLDF